MNARSHVSIATLTVLGLATVLGTGCAAQVDGSESTANGSEAANRGGFAGLPSRPSLPPVTIPQASCSWDGMAWAAAMGGAYQDPGIGFYGAALGAGTYDAHASPSSCAANSDNPLLTNEERALIGAERVLMGAGCSQPFYWESWDAHRGRNSAISDDQWAACQRRPSFGCYNQEVNAILMLCPLSGSVGNYSLTTYIQSIPATAYFGVPTDQHANWADNTDYSRPPLPWPTGGFFDTVVAKPPSGYGWVQVWADPHGCIGGCMSKI